MVLQVESAASEPKPYLEEPVRTMPLQGPQIQEKTPSPRAAQSASQQGTCPSGETPHTRHQVNSHPSNQPLATIAYKCSIGL